MPADVLHNYVEYLFRRFGQPFLVSSNGPLVRSVLRRGVGSCVLDYPAPLRPIYTVSD